MKRSISALFLFAILAGCGGSPATTQSSGTVMTAKPWQLDVNETVGGLGDVTFTLSSGSCGTVTGPACFTGGNLAASGGTVAGTPVSLTVGVPAATNGSGASFHFLYVYNVSGQDWNILGSGAFAPNGNVSGTWQCDTSPSSPCGTSGTFTAAQQ